LGYNDYSKEDKSFTRSVHSALENGGLNLIQIPFNPYRNKSDISAEGIYINYLEVDGNIILPVYQMKEDDTVARLFEQLFPIKRISTLSSNEIAMKGGVLNCITWNIKV
jgi:agmatine deiminase